MDSQAVTEERPRCSLCGSNVKSARVFYSSMQGTHVCDRIVDCKRRRDKKKQA
jgi:hypothetical protein